jgi:hypothetical protein
LPFGSKVSLHYKLRISPLVFGVFVICCNGKISQGANSQRADYADLCDRSECLLMKRRTYFDVFSEMQRVFQDRPLNIAELGCFQIEPWPPFGPAIERRVKRLAGLLPETTFCTSRLKASNA